MEEIIKFFETTGKLKTTKRTGWVKRGVPNSESVADHSFRTTLMSFILAEKQGLDVNKCIKLALVHDLAESIVGDITPHEKELKEQKHTLEQDAIKKLSKLIDKKELVDLWKEFEDKKTPESRFVYEMDLLEMLMQANEYKKNYPNVDLDEFWPYVEERISSPLSKKFFSNLKSITRK